MTALSALWLPILVSAVAVFVVSSIIHMTPLWHKTDYPRFTNEDRVLDALRPMGIPPGDYMMPRPASSAEMRSPAAASCNRPAGSPDRKSTRLNSSHVRISYAVFCLK